ncbi:MAG: hypothetical protein CM1200mP12_00260 [Gammaproteobacteria bacterium]|nr:MAG: hypothetical protein CM1200mP12_00260 [Gammaproteobacteria bacterium]
MIASESTVLDTLGFDVTGDVGPGKLFSLAKKVK